MRVPHLLTLSLLISVPTDAAAKNCTLTSTGLLPSTYQRSAAHQAAGLLAAAGITPRATNGAPSASGKTLLVILGMSNAHDYATPEVREIHNDPARPVTFRAVTAAQSGKTASDWANPSDPAWATTLNKVAIQGTPQQVQAAHIYMTEAFPDTHGAMTAQQLQQIVANASAYFPHLRVVYLSPIGYTGYADADDPRRAPVEYVHADSLLMAARASAGTGWPVGVWVELLDIWADGLVPNPRTAAPSTHAGLTYACSDVVDDGVHPTLAGRETVGINVYERLRADPVTAGWMFGAVLPSPPTAPATGPVDEAVLTGDDVSCLLTGRLPHQGSVPISTSVPLAWCAGL